jgi:hypothetical protein
MSLASNDQPPAPPRPPDVLLHAIQALTAAANIGGTEAILAGRPGSWEAETVRQVLQSTEQRRIPVEPPNRADHDHH